MPDWVSAILAEITWTRVLVGGVVFVATLIGSVIVVGFLLIKLPAKYFQAKHKRDLWIDRHPVLRWSARIVKNLIGVALVLVGTVMLVGPGQGVLTILIGVMLLEFPGKRRLELYLVTRPKVLRGINRLRARFGKPPLEFDPPEDVPRDVATDATQRSATGDRSADLASESASS